MISTFLFDIGNVVWDFGSFFSLLKYRWAQLLGLSFEEFTKIYDEYYQQFEDNSKTLSDFLTLHGHPELEPQFLEALNIIYDTQQFSDYLHLPVINLITSLRSVFKVGYLSNAEYFFYPHVQQKIEKYFDWGYCSWQLTSRKPSIEIFQQTLALRGLTPSEVVFIDDTQKNIDAAASLGIHAIHFQSDTQLLTDLQSLTSVIASEAWQSSNLQTV